MNAANNVSQPAQKSNQMPKVFPKKEIARQRIPIQKPAAPSLPVRPTGSSRAGAPPESAPCNTSKQRASASSQPASIGRSKESNAVKPKGHPPVAGTERTEIVHFECIAPHAKVVFVAGSFNGWNPAATPMTCVGEGKWVKELSLCPDRYEYQFVVDGRWTPDLRADDEIPNPFGSFNSVKHVLATI